MSIPINWHKAFAEVAATCKKRRKRLGMTQAELGFRIGRSTAYISAFENGRSKSLGFYDFLAICASLGEAPHEVLRKAIIKCPSEGINERQIVRGVI